MKKCTLLILFAVLSFCCRAQSALCLENNSDCDAYFAVYAELTGPPCSAASTGCTTYRADYIIPPHSSQCFTNYTDYDNQSALQAVGFRGWSTPIPAAPLCNSCFRYTRVEIQQLAPCPGCGVTVGINACGLSPTATNCGSYTARWFATPGGVPGDITVTWPL